MDIISVLQGPGPETGLFLAATVDVNISDDGREATFTILNETPTTPENPDPLIDQYFFNLSDFNPEVQQITLQSVLYIPADGQPTDGRWQFRNSAGPPPGGFDHNSGGCGRFQYVMTVIRGRFDQRLRAGDSLVFTLRTTSPNLLFTEEAFENAPPAQRGIAQEAFSFQRLGPNGQLSDCLDTERIVHMLSPEPPDPPEPPVPPPPTHTIMPLPPVVPEVDPADQQIVVRVHVTGTGTQTILQALPAPGHQFASDEGPFFFIAATFTVDDQE